MNSGSFWYPRPVRAISLDMDPTSACWRAVREAPRRILLLDYDGTLAPFRIDRSAARPMNGVVPRLAAIASAPRSRVALVSGRRAHEVRSLLGQDLGLEIWGSHGVERLRADGELRTWPVPAAGQAALKKAYDGGIAELAADIRGPSADFDWQAHLELKAGGLAIHSRGLGEVEAGALAEAAKRFLRAQNGALPLRLQEFDGGSELRLNVRDKGDAVRDILEEEPANAAAAYLGDDRTDEDAFRALPESALSILVAADSRATAARFRVAPGESVLRFLDAWKSALDSPPVLDPRGRGEER